MVEVRQAQPASYVGFDLITSQIENKLLKRGFTFNIMVVGQSGLGKSTLVNTLFSSNILESKPISAIPDIQSPSAGKPASTQTTEINQVTYTMQENDVRLKLNVIDTPGYGDYVNNDYCWEPITRYVKDQYALYLRKELSPSREKRIPDTRVHCILYFIAPTGHSLKPIDIITMKKLGDIANVVPVISKADSLTIEERQGFKKRIQAELQFHGINTFPFVSMAEEETDQERDMKQKILNLIPFAIVGSETVVSMDGKNVRVRKCKSGLVVIEDPTHCDFVHLQNFLIRTHMQSLIETTSLVHYENFRTRQLLALKEASKSNH